MSVELGFASVKSGERAPRELSSGGAFGAECLHHNSSLGGAWFDISQVNGAPLVRAIIITRY
jgi:hypothetical protein